MKIRRPLNSNPDKAREWQQRSQQKAIQRLRERGAKLAPTEPKRGSGKPAGRLRTVHKQNDAPWRNDCIAEYGEWCRCCGSPHGVQMDHIWPKSQGGKNEVGNGLPLCSTCHRRKTDSEIKIEWSWLTPLHLAYLKEVGWVDWDDDGQPFGRGWKHFGARRTGSGERKESYGQGNG
ncbi:HNH endonuclease [Arthrobacter phage KellEzio]|uniref:HNH endonuclease n=1 Tax=Arthrobacter phage KellEzio TaxID=1796995 RepID=A0A140G6G1_9CAUD|nr:HNH endonuclease [Arthrobacter phage KellEzio]AMM44246.1 HNH endonuclease [Arthrobacter phage KellEzio]